MTRPFTKTRPVFAVAWSVLLTAILLALAMALVSGCEKDKEGGTAGSTAGTAGAAAAADPAAAGSPATTAGSTEGTFATADDAARALVAAVRDRDKPALSHMFGDDANDILFSGDEVVDRERRAKFLTAYDAAHKLVTEANGDVTLVVGPQDWPLPIPIVKDADTNRWYFDTDTGKEEILNRRIGQNELDVIQVCQAIVDAQKDYAAGDPNGDGVPEYARQFLSDSGKHNGLYWPTAPGAAPSPLGPLVADAVDEGYSATRPSEEEGPRPYHGYYYRILDAQGEHAPGGAMSYVINGKFIGGFAVVAYPAVYGNSGIMTFVVNQDGVVYQKDLGKDTAAVAKAMAAYDPDSTWKKAGANEDEPATAPTTAPVTDAAR